MGNLADLLWERTITSRHGELSARLYRDSSRNVGLALWTGDLGGTEPVLSRLHSSCFTSEGICGLDCDCVAQLDLAIEMICKSGRGIVFYLLQEGRGAGLPNKARDRSIVQTSGGRIDTYTAYGMLGLEPDPRRYDVIKPMCAALGIEAPLTLMTNNPAKIDLLRAVGLDIVPIEHVRTASRYNAQYIQAKAKFGHLMPSPDISISLPPGIAMAMPGPDRVGQFTRAATYMLPINVGGGPTWFRAVSYIHDSGHDRMLLSFTSTIHVPTEVRYVYREELPARIAGEGTELAGYKAALLRIVGHGAGAVLTVPCDPGYILEKAGPTPEEDLELLHADGASRDRAPIEEVA